MCRGDRRRALLGQLEPVSAHAILPLELAAELKSATPPRLLDVREPEESELVTLPAAKLVPLGQLPARVGELEAWREEEIVVYCHHGIRSQHAIGYLRQMGFTRLRNLTGGIDAWALTVEPWMLRY